MLVTFVPTGENVEVGPGAATPQKLAAMTSNPIYIDTPSGYTPVQGEMADGSKANFPILGAANGAYIAFYAGENKTLLVTKFKMDDAAAVTAGLAAIAAALTAGNAVLQLDSDGNP